MLDSLDPYSRNEVLAREGIDTYSNISTQVQIKFCRNEVLAREGLDILWLTDRCPQRTYGRNEVPAREGIDTQLGTSLENPISSSRNEA